MNRLPTAECIVNAPGNVYGIALEPPCWHASRLSALNIRTVTSISPTDNLQFQRINNK